MSSGSGTGPRTPRADVAVDVVILTPLALEYSAACEYLQDAQRLAEEPFPTTRGVLAGYTTVVSMPPQTGGYGATDITRRAISIWRPRWFAVVGVAGGFSQKGVGVGDVLIASRVYGYEHGKVHEQRFVRRDLYDAEPDSSWLAYAKVLEEEQYGRQAAWATRIRGTKRPDRRKLAATRIYVGPIASGEKVVDDPDYAFFQDAIRELPELYGVEMEAAGAAAALRNLRSENDRAIGFLMIRGVSDVPRPPGGDSGPRGTTQRDRWKPFAARAAMAALEHLLAERRPPYTPGQLATQGESRVEGSNASKYPSPAEARSRAPAPAVSISRLPVTGQVFAGRDAELALLDAAWDDPATAVVEITAWGGVGKSALVSRWVRSLAARGYPGAERVFAWSFYSQGADRAGSADLFVATALRWFGDSEPAEGSAWDRGERLARLVSASRTLLVLDGLEPLQFPPGPRAGRLKDEMLRALLRELAADNPGLCVVTTRLPVADIEDVGAPAVVRVHLDHLPPLAGAQVLRELGVHGSPADLKAASREVAGHCLALTLLGTYLRDALGGDVTRRSEVRLLGDDRHGEHAAHILDAYEAWFAGKPEAAIVQLLGLFDGPADAAALRALRSAPPIRHLTDQLVGLDEPSWRRAVAGLRQAGLVAGHLENEAGLDAHPLVREYFGERLRREHPEAWARGHERLYRHYRRVAKPRPSTVEEMAPLFSAVVHGCHAGRHQEALLEVYQRRIQRGANAYSTRVLGATGSELAVLSAFFAVPWSQPLRALSSEVKSYVLGEAGAALQAVGRLEEAIGPMEAGLATDLRLKAWRNAAVQAGNLGDVYLAFGHLDRALAFTRRSLRLAKRADDTLHQVDARARVGAVLHQLGRRARAREAFREAEAWQAAVDPNHPILYSTRGYAYCDLLLDDGLVDDVLDRARRALAWSSAEGWLLETALDRLSLARALLAAAGPDQPTHIAAARGELEAAVEGLRRAGRQDRLPPALIARAELRRRLGDVGRALDDLNDALRMAERGSMRLHRVDCHLALARTYLDAGPDGHAQAAEHLQLVEAGIAVTGYGRRTAEHQSLSADLAATRRAISGEYPAGVHPEHTD